MTCLNAIAAQHSCSNPMCETSSFSNLTSSFLNLFSHEKTLSTTHRLGFFPASDSRFSSPLGLMCGIIPASLTTRSIPV